MAVPSPNCPDTATSRGGSASAVAGRAAIRTAIRPVTVRRMGLLGSDGRRQYRRGPVPAHVGGFAGTHPRYPRRREVSNVREFDDGGPRSDGPAVVWAGLEHGPALVVVDPTGAARHNDLPATWHAVRDHFQIAWCRVPASTRSLEDIEDVLETLAERRAPVTMVAA